MVSKYQKPAQDQIYIIIIPRPNNILMPWLLIVLRQKISEVLVDHRATDIYNIVAQQDFLVVYMCLIMSNTCTSCSSSILGALSPW